MESRSGRSRKAATPPANRWCRRDFHNGVRTSFDFDPTTGVVRNATTQRGADTLIDYRLRHDTSGNVLSRHLDRQPADLGGSGLPATDVSREEYRYDDKHQLRRANLDGSRLEFDYLANGCREQVSEDGSDTTFAYEDSKTPHRISQASGGRNRNLTYDLEGRLVRDVNLETRFERRLAWTPSNRLLEVEFRNPEQKVARRLRFGYDAQGQRVVEHDSAKGELVFHLGKDRRIVWDGNGWRASTHVLGLTEPSQPPRPRRLLTLEQRPGSDDVRTYYHRDHLRSVIAVTDGEGKLVGTRQFDPYGRVRSEEGTYQPDVGFTGHRMDVIDFEGFHLYDFGARFYDPDLGVFLSPDPVDDEANSAFGLNRYAYVGNNPLCRFDPTGYEGEDDKDNPLLDAVDQVVDVASEIPKNATRATKGTAMGVKAMPPKDKTKTNLNRKATQKKQKPKKKKTRPTDHNKTGSRRKDRRNPKTGGKNKNRKNIKTNNFTKKIFSKVTQGMVSIARNSDQVLAGASIAIDTATLYKAVKEHGWDSRETSETAAEIGGGTLGAATGVKIAKLVLKNHPAGRVGSFIILFAGGFGGGWAGAEGSKAFQNFIFWR